MKRKLTAEQAREIKEQLTDGVSFTYPSFGSWDEGKRVEFKVSGDPDDRDKVSAIYRPDMTLLGMSMNVEKVTNKAIYLFSYDMACNKTTAKMDLSLIEFI